MQSPLRGGVGDEVRTPEEVAGVSMLCREGCNDDAKGGEEVE